MKKYKLIILFFIITSFNIYAFSFNELTAKLDVDRANRLMKKGNYEGAITLYEKALSKVPNSPEIFYNMGTTMSSIGDIESAVQLFDMAKKSVTENTSKSLILWAFLPEFLFRLLSDTAGSSIKSRRFRSTQRSQTEKSLRSAVRTIKDFVNTYAKRRQQLLVKSPIT